MKPTNNHAYYFCIVNYLKYVIMKRSNFSKQVVIKSDKLGYTDVWNKNSNGNTTKDGFRRHYHGSGNVTNAYGKIVGKSKR